MGQRYDTVIREVSVYDGSGLVRAGAYADLVLFDPTRIIDRGTFEDPKQYPDGIAGVWVNGVMSVRDGKALEVRAGRALRRGGG